MPLLLCNTVERHCPAGFSLEFRGGRDVCWNRSLGFMLREDGIKRR